MADKAKTGKVPSSHSVPCSPVVKSVQILKFLNRTLIPKTKSSTWVKVTPTPIQDGVMNPNSQAINLVVM